MPAELVVSGQNTFAIEGQASVDVWGKLHNRRPSDLLQPGATLFVSLWELFGRGMRSRDPVHERPGDGTFGAFRGEKPA